MLKQQATPRMLFYEIDSKKIIGRKNTIPNNNNTHNSDCHKLNFTHKLRVCFNDCFLFISETRHRRLKPPNYLKIIRNIPSILLVIYRFVQTVALRSFCKVEMNTNSNRCICICVSGRTKLDYYYSYSYSYLLKTITQTGCKLCSASIGIDVWRLCLCAARVNVINTESVNRNILGQTTTITTITTTTIGFIHLNMLWIMTYYNSL
uniref:Uncharacterized protein n=1 Tax=Glossina brevipalpis TaxID=37001 RepID=A0A1A9X1Q2_9MUSC